MRIVGAMPDDEEDRLELMHVAKVFIVGLKVKQLAQDGKKAELLKTLLSKKRRKDENNNEKKNK